MSTLEQRLDRIHEGFKAQAPQEVQAVMHRAVAEVRASGIMTRLPATGTALPSFELLDTGGATVRSADLLGRGPLVLTFYRGLW